MRSMRSAHRVVMYDLAACLRISHTTHITLYTEIHSLYIAYIPFRLLSIIFIHNNNALNNRI